MGAEVSAQSYTREERQRYREKVRQNLDVFERMLSQHSFEFDRPLTGLEIELNLVNADCDPHFANAEVLQADRRPRLPDRAGAVQHRAQRAPAAAARATPRSSSSRTCASRSTRPTPRPARSARGSSRSASCPTIMPEHYEGEWISDNNRYTALNDSIFVARGEDIFLDITGPQGERVATYCDSIAPESACTSVQLHLQVAPADFADHWNAAQALSPGPGRARRELALLLRAAAARRDPHRAVQAGDRHPADRAEEPGRAAAGLLRRALDHLDLRPLRGELALLPGAARRDAPTRTRWPSSRPGRRPTSPSCGCTTAPSTAGTAPSTTSSRAGPHLRVENRVLPGRADDRRHPGQRRLLLRRGPQARDDRAPGVDQDELRRVRGELPPRRPRRHRRPPLLAGLRRGRRRRARPAPPPAARPRGPGGVGRLAGGARPLPRHHRGRAARPASTAPPGRPTRSGASRSAARTDARPCTRCSSSTPST